MAVLWWSAQNWHANRYGVPQDPTQYLVRASTQLGVHHPAHQFSLECPHPQAPSNPHPQAPSKKHSPNRLSPTSSLLDFISQPTPNHQVQTINTSHRPTKNANHHVQNTQPHQQPCLSNPPPQIPDTALQRLPSSQSSPVAHLLRV
ncbi:hypothetical protein PSTG_10588 [Puccinia striiformis f. sp. tritici PST-78]|uniref:Uncharacterized protein n=1 Tax=Puccinia striiformis f. sp. tritici PST-78 TaxID=1165861 RepID=A0A0L0VAE1_9BASI|nr:hypothetical protein PSTG_10588 [Puccinia striiformis f. sp. tritici PST-78]